MFCENCTAVGSKTESQHAPLNKERKEMAMIKGSKRKKGKATLQEHEKREELVQKESCSRR